MSVPYPSTPSRPAWVPYVAWEVLLLLVTVLVLGASIALDDVTRAVLLPLVATTGLLATGFALSLRTATPNLAVGSMALLSGLIFAKLLERDWSTPTAALVAVLAVAVLGLMIALVDAALSGPSWAVTLAANLLVQAVVFAQLGTQMVSVQTGRHGDGFWLVWTFVFVAISVAIGLTWTLTGGLLPSPRRDAAGPRPIDPRSALGSVIGIGGSSLLAAVSGVLLAQYLGAVSPAGDRLSLTFGIVLLGGVSVFGRRGGVAGTVLATFLLCTVVITLAAEGEPFWVSGLAVPGAAVLVGLAVGRVLELVAGPDDEPVVRPNHPGRPTQPA